MSLAQKTLSGFLWTLLSRFGTRLIILIVGIVLARILSPEDFGLIAMLGVFFAVSSSLVESGFTQALLREKTISEFDKSTAFYINISIAVVLYVLLWISAPYISLFFKQPLLENLVKVMGIDLIFKSLSVVQRAVLMQQLRFKLLSGIDISVSIITGIIAILLAYKGFGVWALAIKYFLFSLFVTIAFWIKNPWFPKTFINKESFDRLFGFGVKLVTTGLINTFYRNIYNLVIGKVFLPVTLGLYDRAFLLANQVSSSIYVALGQVIFPILSKTLDDKERFKSAYRKIVVSITFVNFPLTTFMVFAAKPIVIIILGDKWVGAIPFLQLLSVSYFIGHISSISQDLYKILGKPEIYLKFSIINKVIVTITILPGLYFGIWWLIAGSVFAQYIEAFMAMYFTSKEMNYTIKEQMADLIPVFILLVPMILTYLLILALNLDSVVFEFILMIILGFSVYVLTAFLMKSNAFNQISEIVIPHFKSKKAPSKA
jgi:O-antigen/teichoic acid export membrane protein